MRYTILPMNEPKGEGNGWDECAEQDATSFLIEDEEGEQIGAFSTREKAAAYVATLQARV